MSTTNMATAVITITNTLETALTAGLDDFNEMLNWLGEPEDGCRYRHVETANTKGFKGSGNPSELLNVSECRLRL